MEKSNIKKIVLCVIAVIIIIGIVAIGINVNNRSTHINNDNRNEVQQEEMPQEPQGDDIELKEPSSSKQVGTIK